MTDNPTTVTLSDNATLAQFIATPGLVPYCPPVGSLILIEQRAQPVAILTPDTLTALLEGFPLDGEDADPDVARASLFGIGEHLAAVLAVFAGTSVISVSVVDMSGPAAMSDTTLARQAGIAGAVEAVLTALLSATVIGSLPLDMGADDAAPVKSLPSREAWVEANPGALDAADEKARRVAVERLASTITDGIENAGGSEN